MLLRLASISVALAIAAGAFGAHALRASLSPERLATWNTSAHYHLAMSIALVALGLFARSHPLPAGPIALISAGIAVFSGSLYLLCLTDTRWLGAITPIGGTLMILGWAWLAFSAR